MLGVMFLRLHPEVGAVYSEAAPCRGCVCDALRGWERMEEHLLEGIAERRGERLHSTHRDAAPATQRRELASIRRSHFSAE